MKAVNTTLFGLTLFASSILCQSNNFTGVYDVDPLDKRGWSDIGVGLMVERSNAAAQDQNILRRAFAAATSGQFTSRDLPSQTPVDLSFDERGDLIMPADLDSLALGRRGHSQRSRRSHLSARGQSERKNRKNRKAKSAARKRNKGSKQRKAANALAALSTGVSRTFASVITWYTGHDLLNPSCVQNSKRTPKDSALIAAVTLVWDDKPACGSFIKLRVSGGDKAVLVRIVDSCAGCTPQSAHIDLTKAAFQKLFNLDVGRIGGIQAQVLKSAPFSKDDWTDSITDLYGPQSL